MANDDCWQQSSLHGSVDLYHFAKSLVHIITLHVAASLDSNVDRGMEEAGRVTQRGMSKAPCRILPGIKPGWM